MFTQINVAIKQKIFYNQSNNTHKKGVVCMFTLKEGRYASYIQ